MSLKSKFLAFSFLLAVSLFASYQNFVPNTINSDWADTMFMRLTGRPPTDDELTRMTALIASKQTPAALEIATRHPDFLNTTIRIFCAQMSTRVERPDEQFNDFIATCMGIVRDDLPVTEFLTANYIYQFENAPAPYEGRGYNLWANFRSVSGIEYKTDVAATLRKTASQMVVLNPTTGIEPTAAAPHPDPAGLLTTSTFTAEHTSAGTNRRMIEYAFREFMCRPMTEMADPNVSDQWIGRDVDRAPGGDNKVFQTNCRSCHGIMDGFRGAFAYFNNTNYLPEVNRPPIVASPVVVAKYARNAEFYPAGHVTQDDAFENLATLGSNGDYFGWRGPLTGHGAGEFGKMLSRSRGFSRCMVSRAIEAVCLRKPEFDDMATFVYPEADQLEADQYNLRRLFARVAANSKCITQGESK